MSISKSKYTRFCQCPKILWMDKHMPEKAVVDDAVKQRFADGHTVGNLARGLLGKYTDVTSYKEDGSLDIAAMIEKTKELVQNGTRNICEAAFFADNLYCAVDILHKTDGGYEIYEVKSSTKVKSVHICDLAYQKYVTEKAGIKVKDCYLVHLNNEYVRQGDIDIKKLFAVEKLTDLLAPYEAQIKDNVKRANDIIGEDKEPAIEISINCLEPYGCNYYGYCHRDIPSPSVFDLYRLENKKRYDLYKQGIISYRQVLQNESKFSAMQLRQVRTYIDDLDDHIDISGIKDFLASLRYPLYFLDFETFGMAIPPFDGTKPCRQIPFQYSLHYIEDNNYELKHKEYLAKEGIDPRREIAEKLAADIPENACIVAYNKKFEQGVIKELAECFADLEKRLMKLRANVVDLLDIFSKGYYYSKNMGGSFSIKKVLPALFPSDADLNYDNLTGVNRGDKASAAYSEMQYLSEEQKEELRQELLCYCKLDTLAMVRIWQRLKEIIAERAAGIA